MTFRLAFEKCALYPAKPNFLAGYGLANLRLASRRKLTAYSCHIGRMAGSFNSTRLGYYASSRGNKAWCYCWYSLHQTTQQWPGWVGLGGWLHAISTNRQTGTHLSTNL